jgi:drug/metabolite transporter (DMT)-like permease
MAASAIALLPFALWETTGGRAFPVQPYALASLLFIGLFASLIGNAFWTQCVATLGPTLTGASFHLMAVYASVLAYVLLGEPIRPFHLAGISLILIGFAIAIMPPLGRVPVKAADKPREAAQCS